MLPRKAPGMRLSLIAIAVVCAATPALAQHGSHRPPSPSGSYAGFEAHGIKALSAQEVADLRAGRGMGLALAAELNSHPGPMHALEHADALRLTPAQRHRLEILMANMRRDAVAAGERLIEAERALDRLFAERRATPEAVTEATARVGTEAASVRAIHLVTHIATRALLTEEQVTRYDQLRGYRRAG
jgi:Spy/CpxP family protein refolding chaperone